MLNILFNAYQFVSPHELNFSVESAVCPSYLYCLRLWTEVAAWNFELKCQWIALLIKRESKIKLCLW
jgi:hypothetical protein